MIGIFQDQNNRCYFTQIAGSNQTSSVLMMDLIIKSVKFINSTNYGSIRYKWLIQTLYPLPDSLKSWFSSRLVDQLRIIWIFHVDLSCVSSLRRTYQSVSGFKLRCWYDEVHLSAYWRWFIIIWVWVIICSDVRKKSLIQ